MKVFKFGGASVKDAAGVRNVATVVKRHAQDDLLIVVSAMGKTTNALEEVVRACREGADAKPLIAALRATHEAALREVAPDDGHAATALADAFDALMRYVGRAMEGPADRNYDHIVSFGEVWSTIIVAAHLNAAALPSHWLDAR